MRLRTIGLIITLALGILVIPLAADAQPPKRVRIGYLSGNPPSDTQDALEAFRKKLRDLGYVEGQNLVLESRYADGKYDRLPQLTADLVSLNVDIILTYGTPATLAAKNAVSTIPIVFAAVGDPIVAGIVATERRPGGNVTGVTTINPELSAKRLSLLNEAVPNVPRVAVLADPTFKPSASMVAETRAASQSLRLQVQLVEVRQPNELEAAFKAMTSAKAKALVVLPAPMLISERQRIADLAAKSRIPAIYHLKQFVGVGGLMSYGVSYGESFQQSAVLVDKILKGAKPADLPVEQPWRYELVINLKTAKALGLTIPQSMFIRADEVIQ